MFPAEHDTRANERVHTLTRDEAVAQGRPEKAGERVAHDRRANANDHWLITADEFRAAVEPYTLDFVAGLARGNADEPLEAFRAKLVQLADLYCDRTRKIVSFWTMGFNQSTRGTWLNEQAYMVHLLTGRYAAPGNSAFSLTGQPSACGTAREVGTFAHRLPADMSVENPADRRRAEELWRLPAGTINPKPGSHLTDMMRDLEDGRIKWLWVQVTNPFQSTANANHWVEAARRPDAFIVVSDVYPGVSTGLADLVLPSAMIFEKWGGYGNSERRTQLWRQQVGAPGDARSDLWQILEFSKRFTIREPVGRAAGGRGRRGRRARRPPARRARRRPRAGASARRHPLRRVVRDAGQPAGGLAGCRGGGPSERHRAPPRGRRGSPRRRCSRSTPASAADTRTTWRPSTRISPPMCAACAGRSSRAARPAGASTRRTIPT